MTSRPLPGRMAWTVCALALLGGSAEAQPVPGSNVNMVSGTEWPGGDPFLQRQDEGSMAVSTRNSLHLLAGGNDYRTVDLPGLPGGTMTGDAWLGLFWSRDGGHRWNSTLVAGYPQDTSPEGMASPVKGLQAGADPVVRAGTNGLMYYIGIAFNRASITQDASGGGKTGKLFISRYIDDNARETGNPFRATGQFVVDHGSDGRFLDKPWAAVDIPRAGAGTCTIPGSGDIPAQSFPAGNIYVSYTIFVSNNPNFLRTKVMFARSSDCGATWQTQKLSEGYPINQGTVVAIEPSTGAVYVAWRRFKTDLQPDALMIAKSTDGGKLFSKATEIVTFGSYTLADGVTTVSELFEQGLSFYSFRTTNFPALAVDNSGVVYAAWSQRGIGPSGAARIMMRRSSDGLTWTEPPFPVNNTSDPGHQLMPSLLFHAGRMDALYYNLVEDHSIGYLVPGVPGAFTETREDTGNLPHEPGAVFNDFIADFAPAGQPPLVRRHTMDVWIAEGIPSGPGTVMSSPARRVSQYVFGDDPTPSSSEPSDIVQYQFFPPNLPLFACAGELANCRAFIGDYIDLAGAPTFVPSGSGWTYNASALVSRVLHAVWTDNRDVRPPSDGQWQNYTPPYSPFSPQSSTTVPSLFDPSQARPGCEPAAPGFTRAGMRNQNLYTARLTEGLVAGSPQNAKPLGYTTIDDVTYLLQRAFVVFVQNTTSETRTFKLTIANQPPFGKASFLQFSTPPFPDPLTELFVRVPPKSTATRSVFVTSSNPDASVTVNVDEYTDVGGELIPPGAGGLNAVVVLNPDITNPDITNPDITNPDITNPDITNAEVYNPDITNPDITNPDITNPDITNPDITNPDITNPDITNPDITNVQLFNPDITNPDITNPDITNPDITNPDITNPDITNPDITNGTVTDGTWTVRDHGNTNAGYKVKLLTNGSVPPDFKTQLIIHRGYSTPVAAGPDGCALAVQRQTILVANIPNPTFESALSADILDPDITNPDVTNATLYVGPGSDWAQITLRIVDTDPANGPTPEQFLASSVTPLVIAQAVNTENAIAGSTTPSFDVPPDTGGPTPFLVVNTNDSGAGSLRDALAAANAHPGIDAVVFDIPGAAPHVIAPVSALPAVESPAVIDATAAGVCTGAPTVQISGASAGAGVAGLVVTAGDMIIRGLSITGFSSTGVRLEMGGGNLLECNYIGISPDGITAAGNGSNGVHIIDSAGNTIGGSVAAGNLVSSNTGEGVRIDGALATGNLVQRNYIGTDATGTVDRGNTASGVFIRRAPANSVIGNLVSGNDTFAGIAICGDAVFCGGGDFGTPGNNAAGTIVRGNVVGLSATGLALGNAGIGVSLDGVPNSVVGGDTAGDSNIIAANGGPGVRIFNTSPDNNLVRGNYIGTDASGNADLGNGSDGVRIESGTNNVVSGREDDRTAPNVIRFNAGAGISVTGGTDSRLRINRIDANDGLGIDVSPDGVTTAGAPALTGATIADSTVTVSGTLTSTPNTTFTIDLYSSDACDTSGFGEGRQWFGAFTLTTDGEGSAAFNIGFGGGVVTAGQAVTALATNGDFVTPVATTGTTSEFSNCVTAGAPIP